MATEHPNPRAMKKIAKILGAAVGSSGGGVCATWAIANAKNKNMNVPISSDKKVVKLFLCASGRNPIIAPVWPKRKRGMMAMMCVSWCSDEAKRQDGCQAAIWKDTGRRENARLYLYLE